MPAVKRVLDLRGLDPYVKCQLINEAVAIEVAGLHMGKESEKETPDFWYDRYGKIIGTRRSDCPEYSTCAPMVLPLLERYPFFSVEKGQGHHYVIDLCQKDEDHTVTSAGESPFFAMAACYAMLRYAGVAVLE